MDVGRRGRRILRLNRVSLKLQDYRNMKHFLENKLESLHVSRDLNHFILSLIPYEKTTTYVKGTIHAPEAIIDASGHMERLDEALGVDPSAYGIETCSPDITDLKSITSYVESIYEPGGTALHGFLGGEHSITPAIIEGLREEDLGIVWIDAHADLRQSYMGQRDNHACAGFNSAPFGSIVQVGIRTLAADEANFLKGSDRVTAYRNWGRPVEESIRALPRKVYLSIDVDGFSPTLIRAVGTPEPGGLSWEEGVQILDFVFREKEVCAYDVVELCPHPDDVVSTFTIAKLIYKVMAYHTLYKLDKGRPRPLL
ncbi:MAG: arginase family protein [Candidatus Latescibacterota bacterium]